MQISSAPAEIGTPLEEIDTPALVIDLDPFERNLRRMADHLADRPVRLRGHAKTHKSADVARRSSSAARPAEAARRTRGAGSRVRSISRSTASRRVSTGRIRALLP